MKKVLFFGILVQILLFSCTKKEDVTPLEVNFTATVTGLAPNAQVTLTNLSTGAEAYNWTFGKGADITSSTDITPGALTIDKKGDITITLKASNSSENKELSKTISITGNSAILAFQDVEFALNAGNSTYGRLFSFETAKVYKDNELNTTVGPTINLAFGSAGNTMYYFESPTVAAYGISGALVTKVTNWFSVSPISISTFDSMVDDSNLSGLTINETNESFGNSSIPGIVLFELSTGRKGVIKTKAVNADRLIVDIKIQKY